MESAQQQPDEFDKIFGTAEPRTRPGSKKDEPARPSAPELQPGLHARGDAAAAAPDGAPVVGDGGASWRMKALKRAQQRADAEGRSLDAEVRERYTSASELVHSLKGAKAASGMSHLRAAHERRGDAAPPRSSDRPALERRGYLQSEEDSQWRMKRPPHRSADDAFQRSSGAHRGAAEDSSRHSGAHPDRRHAAHLSRQRADKTGQGTRPDTSHHSDAGQRARPDIVRGSDTKALHRAADALRAQKHVAGPADEPREQSAELASRAAADADLVQPAPRQKPGEAASAAPAASGGNLSAAAMLRARLRGESVPTANGAHESAQELPHVDHQVSSASHKCAVMQPWPCAHAV